jgi:hypothetical protein
MPPESSFALLDAEPAPLEEALSGPRRHLFRLERRADGRLWLVDASGETPVELARCFPWTEASRYLSLRTADGNERAFVADPDDLDPASARALRAVLTRASLVLDVVKVHAVEEEFELRSFTVETAQGARRFQTPLDGWPRELDDGSLVIEDVYGDLYRIRDVARLDAKSKKLLMPFIG